jgi:F0F1-type ATP synthase membrane subunit b/b'
MCTQVRRDCPEYLMGETMSEQSHLSDLGYEGQFGLERRGYNRLQVDEAIAQLRLELRGQEDSRRDMEERLSRAIDEMERLKLELSAARSNGRPPHEEISERIGQILKLADDEAKSQRNKAEEEIATLRADAKADTDKLRADAKAETDKNRAEAQEQAERMLSAAQEQADSTVSGAKTEAESTRKSAAAEAQHLITDASKQAETAVTTAKSQAKQQLDEATARATAIHDGAERRLNLLMSRHTEAIRRLTEIRDVVTSLVAGEADRGSLEDEVARIVAGTASGEGQPGGRLAGNARPANPAEGRHAGGITSQPDGRPTLSTAQRPGQAMPSQSAPSLAGAGPAGANQPAGQSGQGNGQHTAAAQNRPSPVGAATPERDDDTADGIKIVGN